MGGGVPDEMGRVAVDAFVLFASVSRINACLGTFPDEEQTQASSHDVTGRP